MCGVEKPARVREWESRESEYWERVERERLARGRAGEAHVKKDVCGNARGSRSARGLKSGRGLRGTRVEKRTLHERHVLARHERHARHARQSS